MTALPDEQVAGAPAAATSGYSRSAGRFAAPPILLVLDHPVERQTLGWLLRHHGHPVHEAGTVEHALAIAERVEVALLVVDLVTPRLDGLMVAAKVAARRADVHVLFVTDRGPAEVERLVGAPVEAMRKPFPVARLRERIAALLAAG